MEKSEKFHSDWRECSPPVRDNIKLPRDGVDPFYADSGEDALIQFSLHCSFGDESKAQSGFHSLLH
jgi:hypothetical protein